MAKTQKTKEVEAFRTALEVLNKLGIERQKNMVVPKSDRDELGDEALLIFLAAQAVAKNPTSRNLDVIISFGLQIYEGIDYKMMYQDETLSILSTAIISVLRYLIQKNKSKTIREDFDNLLDSAIIGKDI